MFATCTDLWFSAHLFLSLRWGAVPLIIPNKVSYIKSCFRYMYMKNCLKERALRSPILHMGRDTLLIPTGHVVWLHPLRVLGDTVFPCGLGLLLPWWGAKRGSQRAEPRRAQLGLGAHSNALWETGSRQLLDITARRSPTHAAVELLGIEGWKKKKHLSQSTA